MSAHRRKATDQAFIPAELPNHCCGILQSHLLCCFGNTPFVCFVLSFYSERYLSSAMFADIRSECEQMGINERILYTDLAGRETYLPPLK